MKRQKKMALVNDVTGYGRCSIAVELPLISGLCIADSGFIRAYGLSELLY